jgi:hypothetical protein
VEEWTLRLELQESQHLLLHQHLQQVQQVLLHQEHLQESGA